MKLKDYIKQQIINITAYSLLIFFIILLLLAFKSNASLIVAILILLICTGLICFFTNYYHKKIFYNKLLTNLNNLDQKYLITEVIDKPNTYEEQLIYDILYDINKSMLEHINIQNENITTFKEYVELWIHEVKIPLSNLNLMIHNTKNNTNKKILTQVKKLEDYAEQILYYVRSESSQKDYMIKHDNLKKIINDVIIKNKDALILNKIAVKISDVDYQILTDKKWLSFIINQIINNSIKYHSTSSPEIVISAKKEKQQVILSIYDNGIGITQNDLTRVFEKSFTGINGRKCANATGMGLYICHNLCQKLGHKINITSKNGKFTQVTIIFNEHPFFDTVK